MDAKFTTAELEEEDDRGTQKMQRGRRAPSPPKSPTYEPERDVSPPPLPRATKPRTASTTQHRQAETRYADSDDDDDTPATAPVVRDPKVFDEPRKKQPARQSDERTQRNQNDDEPAPREKPRRQKEETQNNSRRKQPTPASDDDEQPSSQSRRKQPRLSSRSDEKPQQPRRKQTAVASDEDDKPIATHAVAAVPRKEQRDKHSDAQTDACDTKKQPKVTKIVSESNDDAATTKPHDDTKEDDESKDDKTNKRSSAPNEDGPKKKAAPRSSAKPAVADDAPMTEQLQILTELHKLITEECAKTTAEASLVARTRNTLRDWCNISTTRPKA